MQNSAQIERLLRLPRTHQRRAHRALHLDLSVVHKSHGHAVFQGERYWFFEDKLATAHLVVVGRRAGYFQYVVGAFLGSAELTLVHNFLSHQQGPDEDFETILSTLKEQARYWSLASEYSPCVPSWSLCPCIPACSIALQCGRSRQCTPNSSHDACGS
jgi:hypothetical protein